MEEKIHQLEQELLWLKTSQRIGGGSGVGLHVGKVDNVYTAQEYENLFTYVIVFESSGTVNPLITPILNIRYNGQEIHPEGMVDGATCNYTTNMDTSYIQSLAANSSISLPDIQDDTRTAIVILIEDRMFAEGTVSITGDIYASCPGIVSTYIGAYGSSMP